MRFLKQRRCRHDRLGFTRELEIDPSVDDCTEYGGMYSIVQCRDCGKVWFVKHDMREPACGMRRDALGRWERMWST